MALPRHLQDRFNAIDGNPLGSDKPGPTATASDSKAAPDEVGLPVEADVDSSSAAPSHEDGSHDESAGAAVASPGPDGGAQEDVAAAENKKDANYARMEGRYKAQIKRLEEQLAELKEQARSASTLTDLLMRAREELAAARAAASSPPAQDARVDELTEEEQTLHGDFVPVAEKLVARATAPLLQKIAELEAQTGQVDERVGKTSEALFIGEVRARVPEFDAIRNNPDWAQFLQRPVPFTAHTLASALAEAHQARDLDRVVSIFSAFASEHTAAEVTAPPASATPSPAKAGGLAQFATPDRTAANPSGKPQPLFRESDYRAQVDAMRAGRLSKEQFLQFENQFYEAKRAGRISP